MVSLSFIKKQDQFYKIFNQGNSYSTLVNDKELDNNTRQTNTNNRGNSHLATVGINTKQSLYRTIAEHVFQC